MGELKRLNPGNRLNADQRGTAENAGPPVIRRGGAGNDVEAGRPNGEDGPRIEGWSLMSLRVDRTGADQLSVTFAVPLDEPPGPVSVVGSFNDWTPGTHLLVAGGFGLRVVTVQLPHG